MQKKFSIHWSDGELTTVKVNGASYKSIADIPDEDDRTEILLLIAALSEQEPVSTGGDPMTKFVLRLFLGIGILMLVIAAVTGYFTGRAHSREVSAQGNVIEQVVRQDSEGNEFYYPVVMFYLPDGSTRTVTLSVGSYPPAYIDGQVVTVLYDPQQPLVARIQSTSSTITMYTWTIVTGLLGVIFTAVSLGMNRLFNPPPRKAKPAAG